MILFLDFDGVLHPVNRAQGVLSLRDDFEQVMRDFPHVDIVVSSSWRTEYGLEQLRALFSPDIGSRIIGATPNHYDGFTAQPYRREREIDAWLREQGREFEPWIALDDCDWLFSPACARLILTDPDTGFDKEAEIKLRARLK